MGNNISLKGVNKRFNNGGVVVKALDNINLDIEKGSILSVVGYSGCGKSTLLKLLSSMITADSGSVSIPEDISRGVVFQEPRLLSGKTVWKNLELALLKNKDKTTRSKIIQRTLETLELQDFKNSYPGELSGGMAQRTALGRALCREPSFMLLDEPFSALDALLRRKMQEELVSIYLRKKMTVLFVTHDVTEAVYLGGTVIVMDKGQIIDNRKIDLPYPRNISNKEFLDIRDSLLKKIYTSREKL